MILDCSISTFSDYYWASAHPSKVVIRELNLLFVKNINLQNKRCLFSPNGKWIIVKCINCWKGSYKLQMNKNLRMKKTVLACIWLRKAVSFLRAYLADSYLVLKKKSDCCYSSHNLFAVIFFKF